MHFSITLALRFWFHFSYKFGLLVDNANDKYETQNSSLLVYSECGVQQNCDKIYTKTFYMFYTWTPLLELSIWFCIMPTTSLKLISGMKRSHAYNCFFFFLVETMHVIGCFFFFYVCYEFAASYFWITHISVLHPFTSRDLLEEPGL